MGIVAPTAVVNISGGLIKTHERISKRFELDVLLPVIGDGDTIFE